MQTRAFSRRCPRCRFGRSRTGEGLGICAHDAIRDAGRILVLPGPDATPARVLQGEINSPIACDIPLQLRLPIVGVRSRCVAMVWTAMPETTVNENCEASASKDDVRPNKAIWEAEREVDTEAQSATVQLRPNSQLSACVAATVSTHPLAHGRARGIRIGELHVAENPSITAPLCEGAADLGEFEAGWSTA